MFCLCRPDERRIHEYIATQADGDFSYGPVGFTQNGATRERLPGWSVDCHRVVLGSGGKVFRRAIAAIATWQMFPPEITAVFDRHVPFAGLCVAVLFHAKPLPLCLLMPARVVYVTEDSITCDGQQIDRFGFAYGTLPDHPERGEERFLVEWHRDDDSVHYDLLAVSQPRHWLARLAYPYTRWQQASFRRLSGLAMQRAVREESPRLS
ncbi:MAG TPA: DUF1990 domain-containing protein [Pirellulaceae bacterium]|jgi:uncharacterized protein (UPF0548 family)